MSVDKWLRKESEIIAECRVFKVRRDRCQNSSNGESADFFVIENPDWINVIPVTKDGKAILIEQYRHGTEKVTLEIPGGLVDPGETPEECAARELKEETGYEAGRIVSLGSSNPNPAIQSNRIYHFAAFDCCYEGHENPDEHESIETRLVEVSDIPGLIDSGEIEHSLVITGYQRFEAHLARLESHSYES